MRQSQSVNMPLAGALAMNGLSLTQMEELVNEVVELAENGALQPQNGSGRPRGNFFHTPLFRELAEQFSNNRPSLDAEFSVSNGEGIYIHSQTEEVRGRIERQLSRLTRDEPADPHQIFSTVFMEEFDWIMSHREQAVQHACTHQEEFVSNPYDPMLLQELKQQDIADKLGCHFTTVSRLVRNLSIEFPDSITRDVSILIPGASLKYLQGRYAIGVLMNDPTYYEQATGWKVSDTELVRLLKERFDLTVARRTVTKYRDWVDEHLGTLRRNINRSKDLDDE